MFRKNRLFFASSALAVALAGVVPAAFAADASGSAAPVTIAQIQGDGVASPVAGQTVATSGIVTAVFPGMDGFIIQMKTADVPAGFKGSSALFVTQRDANVQQGDAVRVSGRVSDEDGFTTLAADSVEKTGAGQLGAVEPLSSAVPQNEEGRQAIQFMLLQPSGTYRVMGNDLLPYSGQLSLVDGPSPLIQPTQVGRPGSAEAVAHAEYNAQHLVVLDDASRQKFDVRFPDTSTPVPPKQLPYMIPGETWPTLGATVTFKAPVVLMKTSDKWALNPTSANVSDGVSFSAVREPQPAQLQGNFKLATFNVLNYFSDLGVDSTAKDAKGNPLCIPTLDLWTKSIPVAGNWDCPRRGAWDNAGLKRQQAKIVNAINKLGTAGAQVVALQEIENDLIFSNDVDKSLRHLVEALNQADPSQDWDYVPSPSQTPKYGAKDMIRQAIIYKPAKLERVGDSMYLDDPAYVSAADARAPISQVFLHKQTGQKVLVVNNHLTYKGGKVVGEDNANVGDQKGPAWDTGRNNGDRTRQAKALVRFVSEHPQADNLAATLLVGDFNAYAYEDPIQQIVQAGYHDLMDVKKFPSKHSATDWNEYTYNYRSTFGSLDHVLVSDSAMQYLRGSDIWTSNAYETQAQEYSRFMATGTPYYSDDVFRASDHNAALVAFDFPTVAPVPTPAAEDGAVVSPEPAATPDASDGVAPRAGAGSTASGKGRDASAPLVRTGGDVAAVAGLSALLLAAGAGLVAVRKRRTH